MRYEFARCLFLMAGSVTCVGGIGRVNPIASSTYGVLLQQNQASVLTRAQRAVGTDRLPVRSAILLGTCQSGFNGITGELIKDPSEVEIRMLLPGYWLRVSRRNGVEDWKGFALDEALFGARAISPGARVSSTTAPPATFVQSRRAEAAGLLLGILGDAGGVVAIRLASPGPTRDPDAMVVGGSDGFSAVLELSPDTSLPVRLRRTERVGFPQPLTGEEIRARVPPRGLRWEDAEVTTTFSDHRLVNGLRIPHRVVRSAKGLTLEVLSFDQVVVNPPATPAEFQRFRPSWHACIWVAGSMHSTTS